MLDELVLFELDATLFDELVELELLVLLLKLLFAPTDVFTFDELELDEFALVLLELLFEVFDELLIGGLTTEPSLEPVELFELTLLTLDELLFVSVEFELLELLTTFVLFFESFSSSVLLSSPLVTILPSVSEILEADKSIKIDDILFVIEIIFWVIIILTLFVNTVAIWSQGELPVFNPFIQFWKTPLLKSFPLKVFTLP